MPHRGSRGLGPVLALALLSAVCAVSCSGAGSTAQPPEQSIAAPVLTSALPPGPCGDDQPGRYVAELFEPAAVTTTSFADGLEADIYSPAGDPADCRVGVVWIHGGGFTQGTRNGAAEHAWGDALASRGYVVASIDYRLGAGEPFALDLASGPDQQAVVANAIADGQAAMAWLRTSEAATGVDPERVAIGGTSAGAMTALGAALTAPAGDRPCTVISVAGDLRDDWVTANPPPVLFLHGNADDLVPYQSAVSGVDVLTAAGGQAELVTIDGAGHEITGVPTPDMVLATAGWLREHAAARCG